MSDTELQLGLICVFFLVLLIGAALWIFDLVDERARLRSELEREKRRHDRTFPISERPTREVSYGGSE